MYFMEKSRRRIRICLLCVVLAAVVAGIFYYYYEIQGNAGNTEGTLISIVRKGQVCPWE